MKFFLVLFAVVCTAHVAQAGIFSTLVDMAELKVDPKKLAINKDGGPPLSEEQIQCIKDGLAPIKEKYDTLAEWFEKAEEKVKVFKGKFEVCDELEKSKRRECLVKLKISGFKEAAQFIHKLKPSQKKVTKEIRTVILTCLKKPE